MPSRGGRPGLCESGCLAGGLFRRQRTEVRHPIVSEPSATAGIDLHARQVRKFRLQDKFFHHSTQLFAFVVLAALVGILISLAVEAWPSLAAFGPSFLWTNVWSVPDDEYGALAAIYGTVVTSVLALLIAVPISFGIALFLTETCPV